MLTDSTDDRPVTDRPLTHGACLDAMRHVSEGHGAPAKTWVQVRRYDKAGPYALCGRLITLRVGDKDWFKVETEIDTAWVDGRNVRLCSGDGRCTCEPAGHQTP